MILGFGGKLSGGKTMTSVLYANDQHIGPQKKKILSNITLNLPDMDNVYFMSNDTFINYIRRYHENQEMLKKMFHNSVIIWDEIGNLLSARKSSSLLNDLLTQFIMMAGKLDCDIVYTAQLQESQADIRLRAITNIYGNCYRVNGLTGIPILFADRTPKDQYGNLIPISLVVYLEIDLDLLGKQYKKISYDPSPYYGWYDTREITLLDRTKYLAGGIRDLKTVNTG